MIPPLPPYQGKGQISVNNSQIVMYWVAEFDTNLWLTLVKKRFQINC